MCAIRLRQGGGTATRCVARRAAPQRSPAGGNAARGAYTWTSELAWRLAGGHYPPSWAVTIPPQHARTHTYMRYINDIIVHCTDTPAGRDIGIADVRRWHTLPTPEGRGWRDVGYHYLVRIDGTIERGRAISQPGAHCLGHNAHSIGVAYAGGRSADGRTADTRTPAQRAALLKLLATLMTMYRCRIHSHRDYDDGKECPCFDATTEYSGLWAQICAQR